MPPPYFTTRKQISSKSSRPDTADISADVPPALNRLSISLSSLVSIIDVIVSERSADISAICNEAVMNAVRRLVASGGEPTDEAIAECRVNAEDFEKALGKFGPDARKELKDYGMRN